MLGLLKSFTISLLLVSAVLIPATATVVQAASIKSGICGGAELTLDSATCTETTKDSGSDLEKLINKIVNIFSMIVGIVAVIMIIYGGFRYVTSGGDSANVGAAKTTIIYALVGLVIVALAQIIVKFVLSTFIK